MRVGRLIGILAILLQKEKVTAPELAEYFEVSRRTINRDIEELCRAGIPVATTQGQGGGIAIMEGYKIDRTLFTNKEMQDILAGLRSLDSINGTNRYVQLMEKLSAGSSDFMTGGQSVLIDLSSWYKNALAFKIEMIRDAIEGRKELAFLYYSPKGRKCPLPDLSDKKVFSGGIEVKALFKPEYKWKLVEEYGAGCYTKQEDGRLLFQSEYTSKDYLIDWLFSFRDGVELIELEEIRKEMGTLIESMRKMYE